MPKRWSEFTEQITLKETDQVMLLDTTEPDLADQNKRLPGLKTILDEKLSLTGGIMSGSLGVQTINPVGGHTDVGPVEFSSTGVIIESGVPLVVNEIASESTLGVLLEEASLLTNDGIKTTKIKALADDADLLAEKNGTGRINIANAIFDYAALTGSDLAVDNIHVSNLFKGSEDHLNIKDATIFESTIGTGITNNSILVNKGNDPAVGISGSNNQFLAGVTGGEPVFRALTGADFTTPTTGTWTPVAGDGTNNFTLTTAVGIYARMGKLYWATGRISWNSRGSATGATAFRISLPDTTQNVTDCVWTFSLGIVAGMPVNDQLTCRASENTSAVVFRNLANSSTQSTVNCSAVSNTGSLEFTGFFIAA